MFVTKSSVIYVAWLWDFARQVYWDMVVCCQHTMHPVDMYS